MNIYFVRRDTVMLYQKYPGKSLRHIIGGPFIWAPLLFALILDLFVEMYQYVCFPLYGLEKVNRRDYISIWDRPRLKYLTWYQKLRCAYCGYMNGVFAYWGEIAHRTEGYRCGIIHQENNLKGHEYQHAH